jgi:predicted amidohydrolase
MIQAAKKHNVYVIWGMTERDRDRFDVLYNTSVLVGPEGFVGSYRKVHQPLDELHVYYPGNDFPVYDTAIGKIGMLICFDKSFPESTRELALRGAEILVMPTAWPMSNVGANPETDNMGYLYDLYDRVRACENGCWFISSNHIGISGDHDYYGHSQIVGPGGDIKVSTGYKEGLVLSEVDLQGEILRARTEDFVGLYMIKDRRPHAYRELASIRHAGPMEVAGQTPLQTRNNTSEIMDVVQQGYAKV